MNIQMFIERKNTHARTHTHLQVDLLRARRAVKHTQATVTHSHQCEWHYKSWGIWLLDVSSIPLSTIHLSHRGRRRTRGERGRQSVREREGAREGESLQSPTGNRPRTFCTGLFVGEMENTFLFLMNLTFLSVGFCRIPCLSALHLSVWLAESLCVCSSA